jgi:hypothetical protein
MRYFISLIVCLFASVCFGQKNTDVFFPASWNTDGMSELFQGNNNFQGIDIGTNYGLSAVQVWPTAYQGSPNAPVEGIIGFDLLTPSGTPLVTLPPGATDYWSISLNDSNSMYTSIAGIEVIAIGAHPIWELTSGTTWSLITTATAGSPITDSGIQNYSVNQFPTTAYFAVDNATLGIGTPPTNNSWQISSGSWNTATNWSLGVPTASSTSSLNLSTTGNVYINNGGTTTISSGLAACDQLTLGAWTSITGGGFGIISMTGGSLNVTYNEYVGYGTSGVFNQSGGNHTIGTALWIGNSYNSYYNLTGGYLSTPTEYISSNGTATFVQTAGTNSTGTINLTNTAGDVGTYVLAGGLLIASNEQIGYEGVATFSQSGGVNSVYSLSLGNGGTYNLNGGTMQMYGGFRMCLAQAGTFNFNGGVIQVTSAGDPFNSGITYNVLSGGLTINTNGNNLNIAESMSGYGGLTFIGGGMINLTGSMGTQGYTTIGPGTTLGINTSVLQSNTVNNGVLSFSQSYAGIFYGNISGSGNVTIGGTGLELAGNNTYTGNTYLTSGSLQVDNAMSNAPGQIQLNPNTCLIANASIPRSITGDLNSTIYANKGTVTLGDSTSYSGFNHSGTLLVGSNNVTLNSAAFANLGINTTLSGGTINAPNGISLGTGCAFTGSGTVNGKVAAGYGSTIAATGNLTLGDTGSYAGFESNGELYVGSNTITLNSNNAAGNKNAVVLGSLTSVASGTLNAPNGILLQNGDNLIATSGGVVTGGSNSQFLNRGNVQGPASSNWLTFNILFRGSTGHTSGRIAFNNGFATGDSPGVNYQYGATMLGGSGTEFDLGGPNPGTGANNYGQLNILDDPNNSLNKGDLILSASPTTTFNVVDYNGFVPYVGETFDILNWSGSLTGTASLHYDTAFATEGIAFTSQWNSNSLVLTATSAVPEPTTIVLLAAVILGCILMYPQLIMQFIKRNT